MSAGDASLKHWQLGMRGRLTLWFVLVAVGAVVFGGGVVYLTGLASIQSTLGQTYCQIASRVARQFEDGIRAQTQFIGGIATDALTTEVAIEANTLYRKRDQSWIDARIARLAREWRKMETAGRRKNLQRQLNHRLFVLAGLQDDSLISVSVFDKLGVLIGASGIPVERVVRDMPWYRTLSPKSDHNVLVEYDKTEGLFSIATPIWAGVDTVGFVRGLYHYSAFLDVIDNVHFGDTGEAILVDFAGIPLRGAPRQGLIQALASKAEPAAQKVETPGPYWITTSLENEWPLWLRLSCIAPTLGVNAWREGFGHPPWAVVVTQAPRESYAVLRKSLGYFALAGLLGAGVAGTGGALMAWRIAAPITKLRDGVRRFARGDRNSLAGISGKDEIGELADEFNDMAERIRVSERELRAFAQAVADAGDAIVMTDTSGVIYYANAAFEQITGYSEQEAKGRKPSMQRSEKTSVAAASAMNRAVASGNAWRGEVWNRRKNGEIYPADLTLSPIRDDTGQLMAFIGIHKDITLAREHRAELEREVEARTREIRETEGLAVMGRMASMIAHDLRNALSTIKMNLQMLLRRHNSASEIENEQCRMGLEQVRYMEEILRDMLIYARPEKIQRSWHDLPDLIDEALAALSNQLAEAGIIVVRNRDDGLPKVYCDRVKLLQILRNLIGNAANAMARGGTLTVSTQMTLVDAEPQMLISIGDTGEGIAPDILTEVFEPFFTTRSRGSGLGLAIVKRLVDQHDGSISIDSAQGEGTIATLTIPIEKQMSERQGGEHSNGQDARG